MLLHILSANTVHIFPMLLGHQEALPKHLHHSWSQSIQFPENWHICLKTGQVILGVCTLYFFHDLDISGSQMLSSLQCLASGQDIHKISFIN